MDCCFSGECGKLLECSLHYCKLKCHDGPCPPCAEVLKQECFCGKVGRKVVCTLEQHGAALYSCGDICENLLSCGNHKCQKKCHDGDCEQCALAPDQVLFCPCGRTKLMKNRSSCLDPVPCCDKVKDSPKRKDTMEYVCLC